MIIWFISFALTSTLFAENLSSLNVNGIPREKIEVLGQHWELIPSIKSMSSNKYKGKKSDIMHEKKGNVYYKKERLLTERTFQVNNEDENHVVYNPKRQKIGRITGELIVTLNQIGDLEDILKNYPVKKVHVESQISVAILKVKKGQNIAEVTSNLKADRRIKEVNIEIKSDSVEAK